MKKQKGFSLLEVLLSLMLLTTTALTLLEQQQQTRQFIRQLLQRYDASRCLDALNETFLVTPDKLPVAPALYNTRVYQQMQRVVFRLDWHNKSKTLIRTLSPVRLLQ